MISDENLIEMGNCNLKKDSSLESFTQLNMGGNEEVSEEIELQDIFNIFIFLAGFKWQSYHTLRTTRYYKVIYGLGGRIETSPRRI